MFPRTRLAVAAAVVALWTTQAPADSADARCDVYPKGSDHTDNMIPGCATPPTRKACMIKTVRGFHHDEP